MNKKNDDSQSKQPKVFISHASEDKERFVLKFAEKLIENGIDAWIDKWEIQIGDNLIKKIFEEGIKEAQSVIVIISQNSISKPWVTKEWTVSVVKQIEEKLKLIPVVLDKCKIPEYFKDTYWIEIQDLNNYENELKEIIMTIFGVNKKPALGQPPKYVLREIENVSNLSKIDSLVLIKSCEIVIENGVPFIEPEMLFNKMLEYKLHKNDILESVVILYENSYFDKLHRVLSGNIIGWQISNYGFEVFAKNCIENYDLIQKKIVALIVNEKVSDLNTLYKITNIPKMIIRHILENLENQNLIKTLRALPDFIGIINVSPRLKRILE